MKKEQAKFVKLRLDEQTIQLIGLEFQAKITAKEIELGLPSRKANESLDNVTENIKKLKLNIKFYQKQLRDGKEIAEKPVVKSKE